MMNSTGSAGATPIQHTSWPASDSVAMPAASAVRTNHDWAGVAPAKAPQREQPRQQLVQQQLEAGPQDPVVDLEDGPGQLLAHRSLEQGHDAPHAELAPGGVARQGTGPGEPHAVGLHPVDVHTGLVELVVMGLIDAVGDVDRAHHRFVGRAVGHAVDQLGAGQDARPRRPPG